MSPKTGNSLDEQETVIIVRPSQIDGEANVYSSIPSMIYHMNKLQTKHPDKVKLIRSDKYGAEFSVPRDWVKVRPKRRVSKTQINNLTKNKE